MNELLLLLVLLLSRSFCQKCRWQATPKHAHTLDPTKLDLEWADYVAVQAECGNQYGNKLTCNLSENIWLQSFQLAGLLWTDRCMKSGIRNRMHELISTSRKKKSASGEILESGGKRPPPPVLLLL